MNHAATTREALLEAARALIREKGADGLSIRELAARSGISTGTVYNYFPGRGEILAALTEEDWHALFHASGEMPDGFMEWSRWFFRAMERGKRAPGALLTSHPAKFGQKEKDAGREVMGRAMAHIRQALRTSLDQDERFREQAWGAGLTKDALVELVMDTALHTPRDGEALLALIARLCEKRRE